MTQFIPMNVHSKYLAVQNSKEIGQHCNLLTRAALKDAILIKNFTQQQLSQELSEKTLADITWQLHSKYWAAQNSKEIDQPIELRKTAKKQTNQLSCAKQQRNRPTNIVICGKWQWFYCQPQIRWQEFLSVQSSFKRCNTTQKNYNAIVLSMLKISH